MADSGQGEGLTHLDEMGRARMVDVGHKPPTARTARASARVRMKASTWALMREGALAKGDALAVARLAGIMAAKETPRLIPLCHSVPLSSVEVHIEEEADADDERVRVRIEATARTVAQTGVEMEALTAAAVAALALYDMGKAHDRAMVIEEIALEEKTGGVRGDYRRQR